MPFILVVCLGMVFCLTPDADTEMFGRAGMLGHGESIHAPGEASHGCLILPRWVRVQMAGEDRRLTVTA